MEEVKVVLPRDLEDFLDWLDSVEKRLHEKDMQDGETIAKKLFGEQNGEESSRIRGGSVNIIPPIGTPGGCAKILYVAFGIKDMHDLRICHSRILAAWQHIANVCRGVTKYVVFHVPYEELRGLGGQRFPQLTQEDILYFIKEYAWWDRHQIYGCLLYTSPSPRDRG